MRQAGHVSRLGPGIELKEPVEPVEPTTPRTHGNPSCHLEAPSAPLHLCISETTQMSHEILGALETSCRHDTNGTRMDVGRFLRSDLHVDMSHDVVRVHLPVFLTLQVERMPFIVRLFARTEHGKPNSLSPLPNPSSWTRSRSYHSISSILISDPPFTRVLALSIGNPTHDCSPIF